MKKPKRENDTVCVRCKLNVILCHGGKANPDGVWKHAASGTTGPSCGEAPLVVMRRISDALEDTLDFATNRWPKTVFRGDYVAELERRRGVRCAGFGPEAPATGVRSSPSRGDPLARTESRGCLPTVTCRLERLSATTATTPCACVRIICLSERKPTTCAT